jgi:hypothetical protein
MLKHINWFLLVGALVILSSCGSRTIGDSQVPATRENKAVHEVLVKYKAALEARDPDSILALVSKDYLENGSTTDTDADDYGYDQLRDVVLPKLLDNVKAIQFKYRVRGIRIIGERARLDYEYTTSFLYSEGGREGWHTKNDLNEMQLVLENGAWKIMGGL